MDITTSTARPGTPAPRVPGPKRLSRDPPHPAMRPYSLAWLSPRWIASTSAATEASALLAAAVAAAAVGVDPVVTAEPPPEEEPGAPSGLREAALLPAAPVGLPSAGFGLVVACGFANGVCPVARGGGEQERDDEWCGCAFADQAGGGGGA